MCVCIRVETCIYVCMYIHVYVHVCVRTHTSVCIYGFLKAGAARRDSETLHIYVSKFTYLYAWDCVFLRVRAACRDSETRIYMCLYLYIYMYVSVSLYMSMCVYIVGL